MATLTLTQVMKMTLSPSMRTYLPFLPFAKEGDLGITKNCRGITLTVTAPKIYNTNRKSRKFLRKIQTESIPKFSDSNYLSNP